MKIFYSTDFQGIWPVGTAAVVRAETEEEARQLLHTKLEESGLGSMFKLTEMTDAESVVILRDGNY